MAHPLGPRSNYVYASDDGNTYRVKLRDLIAEAGGFINAPDGTPGYPRGWKMRRVYGVASDGHRRYIPQATASQQPFQSASGGFTVDEEYTVTGAHGEHRPNI